MGNKFKIKKHMNLTFPELLIYALISSHTNRQGISDVTREWLSEHSGIKKLDTITKHTNTLQDKGLLKKAYYFNEGKKRTRYHVTNPQTDFMWISNDLCKYKPGLIGFLIKLAELRFGPTDTIHLSANEIIKTIGMSKSTFYRYKEELLSDGLLSMNDGEISINSQYFPVFKSYPKEITAFKEQIEQCAAEDPSYKESRVYKEFKKLEKNGFKDIKIPLYKLPEYLESGAFFIKRGDKPVQQSSYPFL